MGLNYCRPALILCCLGMCQNLCRPVAYHRWRFQAETEAPKANPLHAISTRPYNRDCVYDWVRRWCGNAGISTAVDIVLLLTEIKVTRPDQTKRDVTFDPRIQQPPAMSRHQSTAML